MPDNVNDNVNDNEKELERLERKDTALDDILGHPFRVLNDGFIRVVDYMGSDESIVQAARVSYGKGTQTVHQDRGLIRYLIRNRHTTPFEMCEIKFHVRVPMDCWRQWIRHRTANVNEYSTRYSEAIDARQTTLPSEWRKQEKKNKQGSFGLLDESVGMELTKKEEELHEITRKFYEERLELGVAREQARKDLPLSTYTEAYWKIDLHNLLHFLALRMDAHAQWEIREYAAIIGHEIVKKWCPLAWEAFVDYRLNSISFSRVEQELLTLIIGNKVEGAVELGLREGFIRTRKGRLRRNTECNEFEPKLGKLGLSVPWGDVSLVERKEKEPE
ncbi:MAG: FAD-dependent thymidylate synthase [bacterium]|nr:FAD-dependent thymidylate synthase [bacterium]